MSGILTVKTKVTSGQFIESAAKELGLKVTKSSGEIQVQVSHGGYGRVTFQAEKDGTYKANGDTMHRNDVEKFIQACNVQAVKAALAAYGYSVESETGLRNLSKQTSYVIQAG